MCGAIGGRGGAWRLPAADGAREPRPPGRRPHARPAAARPAAAQLACAPDADLLRHPAHGAQAPGQLHRRDHPVRRRPGPRRGDLLRRRPARDHRRLRARRRCASPSTTPPRRCWRPASTPSAASSSARATCPSTPSCAGCSRASPSFGELNRMTQFKDKSGAQRDLVSAGLFFYPVLQAADVLAYRAHEVPVGEDQRQHVELMRDVAERFNARFGETLVVPEGGSRRRRADHGPPGPRAQDVDHRRHAPGHRARARRAGRDRQEDSARPSPTPAARSLRAPDKPGISNLIEILAAVRGTAPEEVEREFDGAGYGAFKQAVADAVVEYLAPVRERYGELRADEAELERILAAGAEKARAIAAETLRRRARGDGRRAGPRPGSSLTAVRLIDLELDLDVFAGPFDLLLTLILREEVDLLEVDLAEVVIAYIDHLERTGRARPRGRHRVPGPDRGAAGAEVAADAARRGARGDRARSRRGGRGAARPPARRPPLPRRGRAPAGAAGRAGGLSVPLRAAPAGAAPGLAAGGPRRL